MLRDEQFEFPREHSTSLQLARLVQRTRNFGEKVVTGAMFLEVDKAFRTVWINCLLYTMPVLNLPSYLVHALSYLRGRTFEASWLTATSFRLVMVVLVAHFLSPFSSSVYVNDMPTTSYHVKLAVYADDMVIIGTSGKPTLLFSYLGLYLIELQRWLSEWRIAMNFSKSSAMTFTRACRRFIQLLSVILREANRMGRQLVIGG
jgi:hypothetical protein